MRSGALACEKPSSEKTGCKVWMACFGLAYAAMHDGIRVPKHCQDSVEGLFEYHCQKEFDVEQDSLDDDFFSGTGIEWPVFRARRDAGFFVLRGITGMKYVKGIRWHEDPCADLQAARGYESYNDAWKTRDLVLFKLSGRLHDVEELPLHYHPFNVLFNLDATNTVTIGKPLAPYGIVVGCAKLPGREAEELVMATLFLEVKKEEGDSGRNGAMIKCPKAGLSKHPGWCLPEMAGSPLLTLPSWRMSDAFGYGRNNGVIPTITPRFASATAFICHLFAAGNHDQLVSCPFAKQLPPCPSRSLEELWVCNSCILLRTPVRRRRMYNCCNSCGAEMRA